MKLSWVLPGHRATMLVNMPKIKQQRSYVTSSQNLISVYNNNVLQRETTIIVSIMNWGNRYKYLVYLENLFIIKLAF